MSEGFLNDTVLELADVSVRRGQATCSIE